MAAIPLPEPPLDDGAVALRPLRADDAPAVVALWGDPEVRRWTAVPPDAGPALAAAWVAGRDGRRRAGRGLDLAVTPAGHGGGGGGGALLGAVSLDEVDVARGRAEVGYSLVAAGRGRGHARRAVALLVGWALTPAVDGGAGLTRLALRVHAANVRSARVAAAVGFRPVGAGADAGDGRPVVTWWRFAGDGAAPARSRASVHL